MLCFTSIDVVAEVIGPIQDVGYLNQARDVELPQRAIENIEHHIGHASYTVQLYNPFVSHKYSLRGSLQYDVGGLRDMSISVLSTQRQTNLLCDSINR